MVDERLDPERSTQAAALFMRDLYDRFGSWELAFAAYNMGYSGLLRAIRKYNTNDFWMLSHLEAGLPFETSLYVAKITAMSIVANNPERFGFAKLTREEPLALAKVDVAPGTGLRAVATAAGLELDKLKALNPHLLRGRIPPGEQSARVYIPRDAYAQFAQRWAKQRSSTAYVSYTTRFGESLEIEEEIDPRARSTMLPSLILQPLVENAVKHGISPKLGGGRVTIEARLENGDLRLAIRDTGVGISDERQIFERGVGLRSVRDRLLHLYGGEYAPQIRSRPGAGTTVSLRIPVVGHA